MTTRLRISDPAETAYRRGWWSLLLFPVSFVAAFVVGEGLFSLLDDGVGDPPLWVVLVAGVPALLVFAVPAAVAAAFGRRAVRLGRRGGMAPALVGGALALSFGAVNAASYVAQTLLE